MSQHTVEVVRIQKEPHPNADSLSIVRVRGFQVVVRTDDWEDGQLAAYVEPDMVMPDSPEYEFLGSRRRIRPKKLRGQWSMGLLVPAPAGAAVGDNVAEALGATRYEPPPAKEARGSMAPSDTAAPPTGINHVYDVENYYRYPILQPGEHVVVTEKIHGANARFTVRPDAGGDLHVGSRNRWVKDGPNVYWRIARQIPEIEALCRALPGFTLFGEIFGWVQDLRYGHGPGEISFRAFDLLDPDGEFLDFEDLSRALRAHGVPAVPLVARGPFSPEMLSLADAPSAIGGGVREGVVIRPERERWDPEVGRVQLKVVSNKYLSRE